MMLLRGFGLVPWWVEPVQSVVLHWGYGFRVFDQHSDLFCLYINLVSHVTGHATTTFNFFRLALSSVKKFRGMHIYNNKFTPINR